MGLRVNARLGPEGGTSVGGPAGRGWVAMGCCATAGAAARRAAKVRRVVVMSAPFHVDCRHAPKRTGCLRGESHFTLQRWRPAEKLGWKSTSRRSAWVLTDLKVILL